MASEGWWGLWGVECSLSRTETAHQQSCASFLAGLHSLVWAGLWGFRFGRWNPPLLALGCPKKGCMYLHGC